jgi:hypothetical protein
MPFLGARGQASRGYFGGGTPPDAPTSVVATRGNAQLSVAFSAPVFNGGLEITTYQYALSTDSYATWTNRPTGTTASPLVITGLTNGTSYQVKLRAVNALGAGAASTASTAVTAATIPGTPTSPSISSGSGSISVSWGAPSDGGDPPLTYTVETQKDSESYVNRGTQTSPYPLSGTGIDNGATYRARITATNTVGSSATAAVTGDTIPSAVPGAPGFSSASSGNGTYTFNWTAPANNGAAITAYTVTITTANQAAWGTSVTDTPANFTSGGNLTYTFSGLSNGSSYRAKVIATNVRGNSAETDSGAGGAQTPSTVPGAPTISSQSSGDQSYTVNWSAPASDGGAGIDYYEVQITDANEQNWSTIASPNPTGTSQSFSGLINGKTYRTRVRAHNGRGFGGYVESSARTATFAAPALGSNGVYRDAANRGVRKIAWAIDPTDIVNGTTTTTYVYLQWTNNSSGGAVTSAEELIETYTGTAFQYHEQSSFTNSGIVVAGEKYRIRAVQYDGTHSVEQPWQVIDIIALATDGREWSVENGVRVYLTGNFIVNGNSYFKVSDKVIPGVNTDNLNDVQYEITTMNVNATGSSSSSASTSLRSFRVLYAGTNDANSSTDSMPTVLNTSSNSNTWAGAGNVSMDQYEFNVDNIGYGYAGYGKVAVDGLGSASTWSPTIVVTVEARGNKRTRVAYNY